MHYLDDFLLVGPPDVPTCQHNLDIFTQVCKELGIPLATEKLEGPSTSLTFLGIVIDTHRMEICLPDDKLQRIYKELLRWLHRKTATKHSTKVVRSGRTFVARMYQTAAKLRELSSLSTIVLNSRDWSKIIWLPEISCFKINLAISFIQKNHWNALVRL